MAQEEPRWPLRNETDKQNVVYLYDRMLLSRKKEGNSDPCYDTDEPQGHYAM